MPWLVASRARRGTGLAPQREAPDPKGTAGTGAGKNRHAQDILVSGPVEGYSIGGAKCFGRRERGPLTAGINRRPTLAFTDTANVFLASGDSLPALRKSATGILFPRHAAFVLE